MEGPDTNGASRGRRGGRDRLLGRRRGQWPRGALPALGFACLVAACLGLALAAYGGATLLAQGSSGPAHPSGRHHARLAPVAAVVSVASDAGRVPVPASYLGLSTEYWALPLWSGEMPLLERVLSLMHVRGNGPLVLRVGGDSADHAFWDPHAAAMPAWAFSLAPKWLSQARALVQTLGVRLILDLNLITDTPGAAAQWARAALAGLPPHSIDAFEVGNEPDIYSRADWLAVTGGRGLAGRIPGWGAGEVGGRQSRRLTLPAALNAGVYLHDFRIYASALEAIEPRVPVAGPALGLPLRHPLWLNTLIEGARRDLGLVTLHRYPYTACPRKRGTRSYATLGHLLSPAASTGLAAGLRPFVDEAHDAGLPLRLTELNSVNCGGRPGVSDAFATALWAPDALFSLLRAGVDGVNLHVRAAAINAPFSLGPAGLQARPLLYGLILFARTLGPHPKLVTLRSHLSRAANVAAWAVRVGTDTLHVLLIDKSPRAERVSLRLPATGTAEVQRLLAPSAASRSGVTLGGRSLADDGRWQGPRASQTVRPRAGAYAVGVRSMSAALVTVRVRPGALGVR